MNDNITCGEALIRLLAEYGADLEVEEVLGGERLVGEATGGGGVPPECLKDLGAKGRVGNRVICSLGLHVSLTTAGAVRRRRLH